MTLPAMTDPAPFGTTTAMVTGTGGAADPAQPFERWTLATVDAVLTAAITDAVGSAEAYEANRALVARGDHFRNGAILPYTGDPSQQQRTVDRLRREQAPTDVVNEILDHDVNGLCGTEAAITFVPLAALPELPDTASEADRDARARALADQRREQDAMLAALSAWWDRVDFWALTRQAATHAEWAQRGTLRAWLPTSALVAPPADAPASTVDNTPRLPAEQAFVDALARIAVSAPEPAHALRYVQPDTQRVCVIVRTRTATSRTAASGTAASGTAASSTAATDDAAELWFLDASGNTVRRTLTRATQPGDGMAPALPLGGALPLGEMRWPRVVLTAALRAQQDALDFDGIAARVATKAAGFRQRATLNAQPTGEWVREKPVGRPFLKSQVQDGVTWYYVETPMLLGPNQALQLTGEEVVDSVTDASGKTVTTRRLADVGVHTEEPVNTEFFTHMLEFRRASMLRDAKQAHLASDGRLQLSGAAYVQARAGFAQKLQNLRGPFERAIRDVLTVAIALADLMTAASDPLKGFLSRYRVQVTARVDAGPLTPEERAQYVDEWKAGAIALPTLQARLGIEDTDAEAKALQRDPLVRLTLLERAAQVMAAVATIPGATVETASRGLAWAGVEPALVAALLPQATDGVPGTPDPAGAGAP